MTAGRRNSMQRKKILRLYLVLLIFSFFPVSTSAELRGITGSDNFRMPPVQSTRFANGMRIYYIKNDLPTLTISVSAGFGTLYEGRKDAGISDLITRSLSLGGSQKYPGNRLYQEIESMGGQFHISSSWENITVSLKVLSRYSGRALDILSDVIMNPNFEKRSVETARSILIEKIKRRNDNPADLGFIKVRELIFDGEGYGSVAKTALMKSFKLTDLKSYWKRYMTGENMVVGVSSSAGYKETAALLKKYLSGVNKGSRARYSTDYNKLKITVKKKSSNIYLIKKNIPQSTVIFGTLAPDIHYSGNYTLALLNYILGGGSFNSRLLREIRVKKGYAYVAHSVLRNRGASGIFLAYTQTKNINVDKVIPIMRDNIERIFTLPVEKSELEWAKNAYYNSYIFRFDTPADIVSNYLSLAYNDLPADYYSRYLGHISKVRDGDILDEGKKLFSNGLVKLVVGPETLKKKLARFGTVVVIDQKDLE